MSDTPRTDRATHGFVQLNPQKTSVDMWSIECVDADFARDLERQLVMQETIANHAKRLALELECLLSDHAMIPAISRWFESATDALQEYQEAIDQVYQPFHSQDFEVVRQ